MMDLLPIAGNVARSSPMGLTGNDQTFDAKRRKTATVALVDDLALSRDCLVSSLLPRFGQEIAIESFASIGDMLSSEAARFDLMLLYLHNRAAENLQAAIEAVADISVPVMVITDDKAADLRLVFADAVEAGICGLVSTADSDAKLLSAAVRFALSGGTFFPSELMARNSDPSMDSLPLKKGTGGLTKRQAEVFAKLQQGKPNKVIAYELGMSESTTKVHIRSIMRTIGATNRTQAVFMGQQRFGSNRASQSYL
jgi:DNA-binding NarL/FixJ family response regulator